MKNKPTQIQKKSMEELKKLSLPSEVTHETTTGTAIQAQVENPKADKETQLNEEFKLSKGQIIPLITLLTHRYRFARIKVNRDIDQQVVNKKIVSIRAAKGIITPFLILTALECLKANIDVVDEQGNIVTMNTPDLDKILVIIDGQHRWNAIKKLRKSGEMYEAYFFLPLTDNYDLMTLLKEANTSVNPWDGIDWLTMAIQQAQVRGIDTTRLEWLKELANTDNISDSAASLYATGGERIISKSRIKSAIDKEDPDELKSLADVEGMDRNRNLYKSVATKLESKIAGLKVTPQTLFGFISTEVKKNVPINDAYDHVIRFIDSLNNDQTKSLKTARKTDDKTKDQVIRDLFKIYWEAWNAKA